jgi:hypothetical protein
VGVLRGCAESLCRYETGTDDHRHAESGRSHAHSKPFPRHTRGPLTDLERFFRRLVSNLAATDPGRLHAPIPLADIAVSIVPYRTNRRALHVDSSEEYEMLLLRLCTGEGGYIRTEPEEVRQKFETEVHSPNPDLEVLHRFEDVSVVLRPDRVAQALIPEEGGLESVPRPVAPPPLPFVAFEEGPEEEIEEDVDEAILDPIEAQEADEEVLERDQTQCVFCGGALPDRPVNFCPHCGQSQIATTCPSCHADVEPGWRHCVTCGVALSGR